MYNIKKPNKPTLIKVSYKQPNEGSNPDFTNCFGATNVDSEQVNACWERTDLNSEDPATNAGVSKLRGLQNTLLENILMQWNNEPKIFDFLV